MRKSIFMFALILFSSGAVFTTSYAQEKPEKKEKQEKKVEKSKEKVETSKENVEEAQKSLYRRAKLDAAARQGKYTVGMETDEKK